MHGKHAGMIYVQFLSCFLGANSIFYCKLDLKCVFWQWYCWELLDWFSIIYASYISRTYYSWLPNMGLQVPAFSFYLRLSVLKCFSYWFF